MNISFALFLIIGIIVLIIGVYLRFKMMNEKSTVFEDSYSVLEVKITRTEDEPDNNQLAALAAENLFSSLHGLLKEKRSEQEHISFEIAASGEQGIRFYVVVPNTILRFVEGQIYAQYPNSQIKVVTDYTQAVNPKHCSYTIGSVKLSKPVYFPIKAFRDLELDPLSSVTSAMSSIEEGENVWFQVICRPIPDDWQQKGYNYVRAVREGNEVIDVSSVFKAVFAVFLRTLGEIIIGILTGIFTTPTNEENGKNKKETRRLGAGEEFDLQAIENKLSRMGFEVVIRVVSAAKEKSAADSNMRSLIASLNQFSTPNHNSFVTKIEPKEEEALDDYVSRNLDSKKSLILSTEELGTVYHFPLSHIDTPNISWVYSTKSEPPSNLPTKDCTYIGETLFRNEKVKFGLKDGDDRLRHLYIIGKSGTGKSSMFISMISQDIMNGHGVGVLDPHGDTIDHLLDRIPDHRIEDVIYFDPSDTENPVGINLMEIENPEQKNLMASGLVSAIKQHFDFSWGPRLEYLLNYSILTLLDVPGTTMMGITRLLEDKNYQNFILHQVKDPVVKRFWEEEYKNMKGNQRLVTEAISPIQNKVNRFLASTTIRNILAQSKSTIDIWDAMNSGKILLFNLSKGKIGSDNANLLGALIVSRIQFYALQRAHIPYNDRRPFYLYVDEFQNFATGSFEEILSESRKYRLGLYLTHQFTAQLPEEILSAVMGNVGTIMTFAVGAPDAREMAREFAPYFDEEDILSLERFEVYIKLMVDGMTSHPFSAKILVPWEDDFMIPLSNNRDKIKEFSRQKYGVDKEYVEGKIKKWIETRFDKGMAIAQEYKRKENNE